MRTSTILLSAFLVLSLGLMGCEDDVPENTAPVARKGPAAKQKVVEEDTSAEEMLENVYAYNPIGKRDPFRSPIQAAGEGPVSSDPLQKYDLDQYQLVGIVWPIEGSDPFAMVQDPTGAGHVIRPGTIIGKSWGTVTQIKTDEVIVTEEIQDTIEDRIITNEFALRLAPSTTENP